MSESVTSFDRQLRIVHVLRAPLGGLFRHVMDLAREQIARGHLVGLIVDSTTGGEQAVSQIAKLDLALGVLRLPISRNPNLRDVPNALKVLSHIRRLKVDVLHGHGSKGGVYARLGGLIGPRKGPLRCYTPHGGSFNYITRPLVQSVYMRVERLLASATDVLLFESVYIATRFNERVGETRALIRIVQNGIALTEFEKVDPEPNATDFLYVGELRAAKGIDTLIDATALLTRRLGRPIRLLLVGSGPDQVALEAKAKLRGVSGQVAFAGSLPARQAFARGRVLVVPSRAESLPYIVLEAAGAQIPMIATHVGGIGEVFGPYRDRLIPPDDAVRLASTMEAMLELPPDIRAAQAKELSDYVAARFSITNMVDAVFAGYRDGLRRRASDEVGAEGRATSLTPCE
jgi:glycosyltransferase involved in cell wall biosynthesis